LANGSFEIVRPGSDYPRKQPGSRDIVGWTVTRGSVDRVGGWQSSDGRWCIDLEGEAAFGGISQTFPTKPGATYLVRYDLAGNPDGAPKVKRMRVQAAEQSTESWFDITGCRRDDMRWR